jgi:hypothetical protein
MSESMIAANVKHVLVIASTPPKTPENPGVIEKWNNFLGILEYNEMPPANTLRIHNNIWVLPIDTGLPFLGSLLKYAAEAEIPLRVVFLEDIPDWIKNPFNMKKKR